MILRGKVKNLVDESRINALLAVELYNKPNLDGRIDGYIIHMIIAWTKIMHAYYHKTIGDKYYHKRNNKYIKVDGEKKTWELSECIKKHNALDESIKQNLDFFIKLRNKIEHSYINCSELEIKIFGECQSLLYNYENFLIDNFGDEYTLNTSLPFSLQFSQMRNKNSYNSSRTLLSKEMVKINDFIDTYRSCVPDYIFNKQEYSIKLVQIPLVSNTNKNDLAVQFVNWDKLEDTEKKEVSKITTLVKNKNNFIEVSNLEKMLPGKVKDIINKKYPKFSFTTNTYLTYIFSIRPSKKWEKDMDKFNTNSKYCIYDETHDDYLYTEKWIDFIMNILEKEKLTLNQIKEIYNKGEKLDINEYE